MRQVTFMMRWDRRIEKGDLSHSSRPGMIGGAISGEGFRRSEKDSGDRKRFSGDEVLSLSC